MNDVLFFSDRVFVGGVSRLTYMLPHVPVCLVQIATAAQLEPATRSLAAECLVTLCEARDKVRHPAAVRTGGHLPASSRAS